MGAWPLEALAERPAVVGDRVFVFDTGGGVSAFNREGQRAWQVRLDAPATGPPIIDGDLVWLLDRDGRLHGRSLSDGSPRRRIDPGALPAGGLIGLGGRVLVPTARGTLQALSLGPGDPRDGRH
ncbi:MAG: PQQ-binding-like beta-propeller repeat protein [Isosphaeraceae bacterium]